MVSKSSKNQQKTSKKPANKKSQQLTKKYILHDNRNKTKKTEKTLRFKFFFSNKFFSKSQLGF